MPIDGVKSQKGDSFCDFGKTHQNKKAVLMDTFRVLGTFSIFVRPRLSPKSQKKIGFDESDGPEAQNL